MMVQYVRSFVLFASFFISPGSTAGEWADVAWNLATSIVGKKVLGGGLNIYDRPFAKIILTGSFPDGYFFDVYHSTALENACLERVGCGGVQEWDLEFGKVFKLNERLTFLGMGSYFALGGRDLRDAYQVRGKFSYNPLGNTSSLRYYADSKWLDILGDAQQGGFMTHVGIEGAWELAKNLSIPLRMDITYDGLPFEERGFLARSGIGLKFRPTKKGPVLEAGVDGYLPLSTFGDRDGELVWRMGVTIDF